VKQTGMLMPSTLPALSQTAPLPVHASSSERTFRLPQCCSVKVSRVSRYVPNQLDLNTSTHTFSVVLETMDSQRPAEAARLTADITEVRSLFPIEGVRLCANKTT